MTAVKICGIMRLEHALAAAAARADFIGLVFARSRRRLTVEQAREIVRGLREQRQDAPQVVGVFADMPADEVNRIAREVGLDRVQLSGHEDLAYARQIELPVIKVVKVRSDTSPQDIRTAISETYDALGPLETLCLVEPYVSGEYGGTGTPFDAESLTKLEGLTYLLAGGLTPETVGEAVRALKPWGVDVSSGVETDGVKDSRKIGQFIFEAQRAGGWRS